MMGKLWINREDASISDLEGMFDTATTGSLQKALEGEYSVCAVFSKGAEETKSALLLKLNAYDSDFFNSRMGNLSYYGGKIKDSDYAPLLQTVLDEAGKMGYRYLFYKIWGSNKFLRDETERQGFDLCNVNVEQQLDIRRGFKRKAQPQTVYTVREATEYDIPTVEEITEDAFRRSRLYKTGIFDQKAVDDYHKKWSRNLILDKDDILLVVESGGAVRGYMSLGIDEKAHSSRLILGAIAKDMRRRGLVSLLVDEIIGRAVGRADFVYAKTQENNTPSINCWKSYGFEYLDYEYGYHKILEQ